MRKVLLVTNDFPPRQGGIQSFVHGMARHLNATQLVVYASTSPGADEFDAAQPFPVIRERTSMLLPTRHATSRAIDIARRYDCDTVWFGSAAPLGLMAGSLKKHSGIETAVALTHGHEAGWCAIPGARGLFRRIGRHVDAMTYLADYFHDRLAPVVGDVTRLDKLTFGIDTDMFVPAADGSAVRRRYGLGQRPTVVCVSRLVPRKGQDLLIDVLAEVRRKVPDTALLLVGDGPYRRALRQRADARGQQDNVIITGAVDLAELPAHYAAGDVFAMPCRTRRFGLDVEGLGVVFLEAAATGLPVIAGDSGGAPDGVIDGRTGHVVGGRDRSALAHALTRLLADPELARDMGAAGRSWMKTEWSWPIKAAQLERLWGFDATAR